MGMMAIAIPFFFSRRLGRKSRLNDKAMGNADLPRILHEASVAMRRLAASPQAALMRQEATQKLLQVQQAFRLADDRSRLRLERKWYGLLEEAARLGIMVTPPQEPTPMP